MYINHLTYFYIINCSCISPVVFLVTRDKFCWYFKRLDMSDDSHFESLNHIWFESYLEERTQSVSIGEAVSAPRTLRYGVPQGSVAGAPGFTYYSAPLSDVIKQHGLDHVIYADDTQVYLIFEPGNHDSKIEVLERCIRDIKAWAVLNKMKFNDDKTEILHCHSRFINSTPPSSITIGDSAVEMSAEARNLGVLFEDNLSMSKQVSNICRAGWACIRRIGKIR